MNEINENLYTPPEIVGKKLASLARIITLVKKETFFCEQLVNELLRQKEIYHGAALPLRSRKGCYWYNDRRYNESYR